MSTQTPTNDAETVSHVARAIEDAVRDGAIAPHSRLMSERELARRYGVKRHIARRAVDALEQKGLIYRLDRSGAFVSEPSFADSASPAPALKAVCFVEHNWPYIPDWVQGFLLEGYSRVLARHALRIRFVREPNSAADFSHIMLPVLPAQEQGCVLGNFAGAELMNWLHEQRIPFVVRSAKLYDRDDLPPHHSVCVNRSMAGFEATRLLLELGHRRIGFLGWLPGSPTQMMYDGYQAALTLSGMRPNPSHMANARGISAEESFAASLGVLRREDRPTAIVAQNDLTALGVISAARSLGLRVPADLSVTGYDDLPDAARSDPPLTTFHNMADDLGAACLETLFEVAAGRVQGWQQRILEPRIVERASAAPPPPEQSPRPAPRAASEQESRP